MFQLIVFICSLTFAVSCQAEQFAVLIGVSGVKSLSSAPRLDGIANDIALAQEISSRLGVPDRNVQTLSDSGTGLLPTKANVTRALREISLQAQPGDFVLLYLSGHGVQQPSTSLTEPDKLDEVFLLVDSQPWVAESGIANALTDKEIRRWLAELNSKLVKVWLVADTCHAGSITRAAKVWLDDGIAISSFKGLRAQWLGVQAWMGKGKADKSTIKKARILSGETKYAASFMAADEAGNALEIELRSNGRKVGLFTWVLHQALFQIAPPILPEKLAQDALEKYRNYPSWVVRPMFEIGGSSQIP